jgi:demethylspheroidene O-methyltransferase
VYTQTLDACFRLDLLGQLARHPMTPHEVAGATALPVEGAWRLLRAAEALGLVQSRSAGRYGLGPLGAPFLGDGGLARMIEHNRLLYETLADPLTVLQRERNATTPIGRFFAYAAAQSPSALPQDEVAPYSALMSATVEPIASEVLDVCSFGGRRSLMDIGGGEGGFLAAVGESYPRLELTLFDLPAVVQRARPHLERAGLRDRLRLVGGDFNTDAIPVGADVVTLVRVLLDHDDDVVRPLLARIREALPRDGMVVIAEALAGVRGARVVGDVYFGFYLAAMGRGRARTARELRTLLHQAGFRRSRVLPTRYPVHTGIVVGLV